jgi:hypothetical protein
VLEELKKIPIEEQIETILNKEKLEKLLLNCNFNEFEDYFDDISEEIEKSEEITDKCLNLIITLIKENEKIRNMFTEISPKLVFDAMYDDMEDSMKKELLSKSIEEELMNLDGFTHFFRDMFDHDITEKQFADQAELWTKEYIENILHKSAEFQLRRLLDYLGKNYVSKKLYYSIKNGINTLIKEKINDNEFLKFIADKYPYFLNESIKENPDIINNQNEKIIIDALLKESYYEAFNYISSETMKRNEKKIEEEFKKQFEKGKLKYIEEILKQKFINENINLIEYLIEKNCVDILEYIPYNMDLPENLIKKLFNSENEHRMFEKHMLYVGKLCTGKNLKIIEYAISKGYNYEISAGTPDEIKSNPKWIEYAINVGQPGAIDYFPEELLNKPENEYLIYLAIEHGYRIHYFSPQLITTTLKYIEYAIEHDNPKAIDYFPEELLNKPENEYLMNLAMEHGYIINDKSPQLMKTNPKCIEYAIYNKQLYDSNFFDKIDESKINQLVDVCIKLFTTNSKSLFSIKKSLIQQLQTLEDPVDAYNKIEKVFIKNNIPLYAKMFFCFKILYPNLTNDKNNMNFYDYSRMSPELKDSTLAHVNIERIIKNPTNNDIRFFIIYNDLLRNAVKSNSKDLRKYLDNIEIGDYLYRKIIGENLSNENFDRLSEKDKLEALEIYVSHLETLYKNTKEGKQDNTDINNYDLIKKIKYLKEKFKITNKYDIKDRIVRSFGYSAGYTSFEQIRNEMNNAIKEAHERGIKLEEELENRPFEFDDGDFVRCIGDYQAFAGSIENGNFSKEFLTVFLGTNDSDTTPLDVDFSLITKKEDISNSIEGTPTGFGFGNIFLIIKKDNPNLNITRDKDGNLIETKYNPKKIEMFGTKIEGTGGFETHWGARTGISLTDVDYILYKESRIDDLPIIKFEIAKHGYYIPIIDFSGKPLFSVNEYNKLRQQMNGMSYYDIDKYNFSDNLEIDESNQIIQLLETSNKNVEIKRNKIFSILSSTLEENNLKLKTKIDGDLTPGSVEVIDTGSTGRKTNKINDGDYDLLLRIDQKIYSEPRKYEELKKNIEETIEKYPYESLGITDKGDYRFKKVKLDENTIVDIDLSFTIKTDKITYSTDECLKDRLKTIEQQDKEKYNLVISNILIAKKVLKEAECYKPERSDKNQGGLGGAGIENWILQNGGSFIDAANNFLETANTCATFNEFKKKYFVWDFGENHFAERKGEYPHDNFVENMNPTGYEKMKECLKQYLQNYNQENRIEQAKTL